MNALSQIRFGPALRAIDASREARNHMSRWAKPEHSKKQVNAAGKVLVDRIVNPRELAYALEVINNFRSIHGHPLNTFQTTSKNQGAAH